MKPLQSKHSIDNKDRIYRTYIESYKKFKHWQGAFYIVMVLVYIIIGSYGNFWGLATSNGEYKKAVSLLNITENYPKIFKSVVVNRLIYSSLKTPILDNKTSWDSLKNYMIKDLRSNKELLDTLNKYLNGKYKLALNNYYSYLNEYLNEKWPEYDEQVRLIDRKSDTAKISGENLKKSYMLGLRSYSEKIMVNFPAKQFNEELFGGLNLPDSILSATLQNAKQMLESKIQEGKKFFDEENKISISSISLSLKNKDYLIPAYIFLYILLFYISILYLNYRELNRNFETNNESNIALPTLANIFRNLLSSNKYYKSQKIISILFNFIIPFLLVCLLSWFLNHLINHLLIYLLIVLQLISIIVFIIYYCKSFKK